MALITTYRSEHFSGVETLWSEAFPNDAPWNAAATSLAEKLRFQPDLMLVALDESRVVSSVMAGYEGHRGWISRIAVAKPHRKQGIGRELIAEAESPPCRPQLHQSEFTGGGSNAATVEFYERAGYRIEPRISMSKRLQPK